MKKTIFVSVILFFTSQAWAQLAYFEAEGHTYYVVENCRPNSKVELYSKRGGGVKVETIQVDQSGKCIVKQESDQPFAFALNPGATQERRYQTSVQHFDQPEFNFQHLKMERRGNQAELSWDAEIFLLGDISFEVQRSENGVFLPMGTLSGRLMTGTHRYSFQIQESGDGLYRVVIKSAKSGERYTSGVKTLSSYGTLNIYPSPASKLITVDMKGINKPTQFQVLDRTGKTVLSGWLSESQPGVDITSLAAGEFILFLVDDQRPRFGRFLKL